MLCPVDAFSSSSWLYEYMFLLCSFYAGSADRAPCPPVRTQAGFPKDFTGCLRDYWAAQKRAQRERQRHTCSVEKRKDDQLDDKQKRKVLRVMSKCWEEQTQGLANKLQGEIFHELLQQPVFYCLQNSEHCIERAVFSNIRNTLSEVKVPHSAAEILFKRATVMACINSRDEVDTRLSFDRALARSLGLHRRNTGFAKARLRFEDENSPFSVIACQRQVHRSTSITEDIKELVFGFWTAETRVSPNNKDICQRRVGRKAVVRHPLHLLDAPQVCIHCIC